MILGSKGVGFIGQAELYPFYDIGKALGAVSQIDFDGGHFLLWLQEHPQLAPLEVHPDHGDEDLTADEHQERQHHELGVREDLHLHGGHARHGGCGDGGEEQV